MLLNRKTKQNKTKKPRHFSHDQFYRHDSSATLVPKSFPPPPPSKTHESASMIQQKKSLLATEIPIYPPVECYKSFE